MLAEHNIGEDVRITRNVRNDGTYPGLERGDLIMRKGAVGTVIDRGTFLQDQIIYTVHFMDADRIVGCREEELIKATDPWVPTKFEFRDKVVALNTFAANGDVLAEAGAAGEIVKVLREAEGGPQYHVLFKGRVLQIKEASLDWADPEQRAAETSGLEGAAS